nr:UPF0481 protein At3g47200-like [Quercus suber]POF26728.1 upf0481 protein [Quercus suber]
MTESKSLDIQLDVASMDNDGRNKKCKEINDQNGETQLESNTSSENKVNIDQLVKNVENSYKSSVQKYDSSTKPCIYRVPGHLRRVNSKAYTPTLISIGPFHHRNKKFETMGELKLRYGERFREREKPDMTNLVNTIVRNIEKIRSYYAKSPLGFPNDNDFVTMILVDVTFILELFLRWFEGTDVFNQENQNSTDPMKAEPWMLSVVTLDLVLLENQLPFFIIMDLYNIVFSTSPKTRPEFVGLVLNFFKDFNFQGKKPEDFNVAKIKHFTDLLRTFYLPGRPTLGQPSTPSKLKRGHWFSGIARKLISCNEAAPESELIKLNDAPASESITSDEVPAGDPKRQKVRILLFSATQLHEAGVKFEKSNTKSLLDIDFDESNGVLKIPVLELNDSAEARIRNVMAYEQFDLGEKIFITDYLIILDFLINTPRDMDLLIGKEIVVNSLGDSKVATSVVNRLNCNVSWLGIDPKYSDICESLNNFGKTPRHRWIAILRHEYFNTPWRGAATIAAFLLLLLTLIQSVCSIFQVV